MVVTSICRASAHPAGVSVVLRSQNPDVLTMTAELLQLKPGRLPYCYSVNHIGGV